MSKDPETLRELLARQYIGMSGNTSLYELQEWRIAEIEKTLTAPLRDEIARLTARIQKADALRSSLGWFVDGNTPLSSEATQTDDTIREYDATATATAPDAASSNYGESATIRNTLDAPDPSEEPKVCDECPETHCRLGGGKRCEVVAAEFEAEREGRRVAYPQVSTDPLVNAELERLHKNADALAHNVYAVFPRLDALTERLDALEGLFTNRDQWLDHLTRRLDGLATGRDEQDKTIRLVMRAQHRQGERIAALETTPAPATEDAPAPLDLTAVVRTALEQMAKTRDWMVRGDLRETLQAVLDSRPPTG